jgi:trigger factor
MNYDVNNIDDNRFELTINISKEDYLDEVQNELKKKRKESNFKGFRKGKTPMGFIKRTFGNAILSDIINKKIDSALSDYLKENNIELMLSPIASDKQKPLDININDPKDFSVSFDLYKKPDFDLKGISQEDEYTIYDIDVDVKIIDDEVNRLKNQFGKFEPYEGDLSAESYITVYAKELDGKDIKENGYDTEFTVKIDELNDSDKKKILKLNVGDEFDFDIYKFLKDSDEKHVRDYLLNIDEKDFKEGEELGIGNSFRGEIKKVEQFIPAELNEDFFTNNNIPDAKSEEDYRDIIRKEIKKHYDSESEKLLHLDISEKLKEINEIKFSTEYIERWIKEQYPDKKDDEITQIIEDSKKDLKWQSIVDKLIKKYNVEVTKEDLAKKLEEQAKGMVGNNPQYISQIIEIMMKDEELVNKTYNEIFIDKIFSEVANDIKKAPVKTTWDEFIVLAKKYSNQAEQNKETTSEEE